MGFEDNRRHLHPAYAQQSRALEFHNCSMFDIGPRLNIIIKYSNWREQGQYTSNCR